MELLFKMLDNWLPALTDIESVSRIPNNLLLKSIRSAGGPQINICCSNIGSFALWSQARAFMSLWRKRQIDTIQMSICLSPAKYNLFVVIWKHFVFIILQFSVAICEVGFPIIKVGDEIRLSDMTWNHVSDMRLFKKCLRKGHRTQWEYMPILPAPTNESPMPSLFRGPPWRAAVWDDYFAADVPQAEQRQKDVFPRTGTRAKIQQIPKMFDRGYILRTTLP